MTEEERRNTIILINEQDEQIGTGEKLDVHQRGILHRAFSVLIYNDAQEMLLQQRALTKYHSGGLWTNACCGHQLVDEPTDDAPHRRLQEEMGFNTDLKKITAFIYNVPVPPNLIEHEFLHVYSGIFNGHIIPNPEEAMNYRWITKEALHEEIKNNPETFTPWFKILVEKLEL
jgi:isopentenyl-diphosphate delta-isomerase